MFGLVFLALIVVPIVELWVLFQVADSFGWAASLLSLLVVSLVGGALVRWQTAGAWGRVVDKIRQGQMPSTELVDGALMVFGGALLLTPGFFTDAIGLAMFIPPLRAIARRFVLRRVNTRVTSFAGVAGVADPLGASFGFGFGSGPRPTDEVIDVEQVRVTRPDETEIPPSNQGGNQ